VARERNVDIRLRALDEASKVFLNVANNSLPQLAKRVAQFAASFASVAAVEQILRKSVDAYIESEKVANQLAGALRAQGLWTDQLLPKLLKQADALSKVSTASDEAIASAQQILISVGGLLGPKLTEATKAALDLAAGLGIDLQQATMMVAKAAEGSTREFSRLGVQFKANTTDAEKLDVVLAFVQRRFGGMAANELNTVAGATAQANKAFGELLETLGEIAVGTVGGAVGINAMTGALRALDEQSKNPRAQGFWTSMAVLFAGAAGTGATAGMAGGPFSMALRQIVDNLEEADKYVQKLDDSLSPEEAAQHSWLKIDADWAAAIERNAKAAAKEAEKLAQVMAKNAAWFKTTPAISTALPFPKATGAQPFDSATGDLGALSEQIDNTGLERRLELLAGVDERWGEMGANVEEVHRLFTAFGESFDEFAATTNTWATEMEATLQGGVATAAAELGGVLVDAAFGAQVEWDKALRSIIQGLVKAVIQAAIFKAIMGAFTGGAGAAFSDGGVAGGYSGGGIAYAAAGMFTPRGTDTVPAMLTPGEVVLNRGVSKSILNGRASLVPNGGGGRSVNLTVVAMDSASFETFLTRNPRALANALDHLDARGY
jgi:hypothetical protein